MAVDVFLVLPRTNSAAIAHRSLSAVDAATGHVYAWGRIAGGTNEWDFEAAENRTVRVSLQDVDPAGRGSNYLLAEFATAKGGPWLHRALDGIQVAAIRETEESSGSSSSSSGGSSQSSSSPSSLTPTSTSSKSYSSKSSRSSSSSSSVSASSTSSSSQSGSSSSQSSSSSSSVTSSSSSSSESSKSSSSQSSGGSSESSSSESSRSSQG